MKLTKEERLNLLSEAITALGKLFQDIAQAPALKEIPDFVPYSELKKIPKII